MKLLLLFLKRSRFRFFLAISGGLISGIVTTVLLGYVNILLQSKSQDDYSVWFIYFALCLFGFVATAGSHYFLIHLTQGVIYDLRMYLCQLILEAPLRQQEKIGTPKIMACLNDDVLNIANIVVNLPYLLVNITIVLSCLTYLGWLSVQMLLGLLLLIIVGSITYIIPVRFAHRQLSIAREHQDDLFGQFQALTEGAKELKIHQVRSSCFLNQFIKNTASAIKRHNIKGITIYAIASNWNRILFFIYVGILIYGIPRVMSEDKNILHSYILVVLYVVGRMEAIMNTLPHLARANVSLVKIRSFNLSFANPMNNTRKCKDDLQLAKIETLELNNIKYSYDDEDSFALESIDLTLRSKEVAFLVGGNGSGKTTLIKVLTGLYPPHSGNVVLNDMVVTEINRENYRQNFSTVFSDIYLFDQILGIDNSKNQALTERYLKYFKLETQVQIRNGKLSTTALSRGQQKRLALLIALLEDRPIYVFDEWAAEQDPVFKEIFYTEILDDLRERGKMVIVITHDDRYLHVADQVVKLEYGKIVHEDILI